MLESYFWRKLLVRTGLAGYCTAARREWQSTLEFVHYYSDRTLALPTADLSQGVFLPGSADPDVIDLAGGVPPFYHTVSAGRWVNERGPNHPWGLPELRALLAERLARAYALEFHPHRELLITHGGSGAFAAVLDAFINPGDAVVLLDPTSPLFPLGLKHRRARTTWIGTWMDGGRCRFAMDRLARAMRGAKMLVLADPVNPTGGVFAAEDLEQIAFWAKKHDVLIYLDHAFDGWRTEATRAHLVGLPNARGRTILAGSLTRSHGLSGVRLGWLAGDTRLLQACAGAILMSAPFVPTLSQRVAAEVVQSSDEAIVRLRREVAERRRFACERLVRMGLVPVPADAGLFVWFPTPGGEPALPFAQRLRRETGVRLTPGEPFGPSGQSHLRLSLATDDGRLREGLHRLECFLGMSPQRPLPVARLVP